MKTKKALTGAQASAYAMKQIDPDVVAAYPITPQTPLMEKFSQYVADGEVSTELIRVESEHSAMSSCVGSAAAGARTMTATSSNGLALMFEIVYIAASLRLPIVMNVVNRALSGPINIHCDHSDTMGCRDSGWIQIYSETAEEAYENTLFAIRLAETVSLPVMVCQDGFITSHSVENVNVLDDKAAKAFIKTYKPKNSLLNIDKPISIGPLDLFDYYFEHKRQQVLAMQQAKIEFKKLSKEFSKLIGKKYDLFETYKLSDADIAIVVMSSTAGTTKHVIDELRKKGIKAGLLKLKLFRPFPDEEIALALKKVKSIAVLDRAASFGSFPPLFGEIRNSLFSLPKKPLVVSYIFGLGGRNISATDIKKVFDDIKKIKTSKKIANLISYLGVRNG